MKTYNSRMYPSTWKKTFQIHNASRRTPAEGAIVCFFSKDYGSENTKDEERWSTGTYEDGYYHRRQHNEPSSRKYYFSVTAECVLAWFELPVRSGGVEAISDPWKTTPQGWQINRETIEENNDRDS